MKTNHTTKLMTALLMLMVVTVQAQAQTPKHENEPTGKTELKPETRSAIRGVGQSVLGAKSGYVASPALASARAELEALRIALDMAAPKFGSVATLSIQGKTAAATGEAYDNKAAKEREKNSREIRVHLEKLRAERAQLEAHSLDRKTDETERSIEQNGVSKLAELEREIDEAQLLPEGEEREKRMANLRERLVPQSRLSLSAETSEIPEPTISTIVEHRH